MRYILISIAYLSV